MAVPENVDRFSWGTLAAVIAGVVGAAFILGLTDFVPWLMDFIQTSIKGLAKNNKRCMSKSFGACFCHGFI